MDIKQLKQETGELPNIEEVTADFEKHWLKPIRKGNNIQHSFLNDLPQEKKADYNNKLLALKKFLHEIKYGQIVNEKLAGLAHNLVDLKIASLTGDYKRAKRLMHSFIKDRDTKLQQLIFEVPYLESQISLLHKSYNGLLEELTAQLPLEHSVPLLDGKHKEAMVKLKNIPEKQKHYLKHIGTHFVQLAKEVKKNKEFKEILKKE